MTLASINVVPGQSSVVQLPSNTFVHATQKSSMTYEARLEDGRPLPTWVTCDPRTGNLTVVAPTGKTEDLNIVIEARDAESRTASTGLTLTMAR